MFEDKDLIQILLPIILVFAVVRIIEWRVSRKLPPVRKALNSLAVGFVMIGVLMFVMILCLPSKFYLESYGYPEQFKSFEEVHKYLQEHNRILLRMREIIDWFLLIFALGFLQLLYSFCKTIVTLKTYDVSTQSKIFDFKSQGNT